LRLFDLRIASIAITSFPDAIAPADAETTRAAQRA
jgi:hypothetical protein